MKIAAITCVAAVTLAGCASVETNTAMDNAQCKLGPTTFTSITGVKKEGPVSKLDQTYAYNQFASSNFRYRSLARNGPVNNLSEDTIRGCDLVEMKEGS
jgi:hypothetical protein